MRGSLLAFRIGDSDRDRLIMRREREPVVQRLKHAVIALPLREAQRAAVPTRS